MIVYSFVSIFSGACSTSRAFCKFCGHGMGCTELIWAENSRAVTLSCPCLPAKGGSAFDKEMCTGASSHAQRSSPQLRDLRGILAADFCFFRLGHGGSGQHERRRTGQQRQQHDKTMIVVICAEILTLLLLHRCHHRDDENDANMSCFY